MLFLSLLDSTPEPTAFDAGDRVIVTRHLLKPMHVTITIRRPISRERFYELTRYHPQGERWPKWVELLIGVTAGTTRPYLLLMLNNDSSMTAQITQCLRELDPGLSCLKWRRLGFFSDVFIHRATFEAEYRSR